MELAIALNRFGLGTRPGDALPADPKAWLKGQLRRFEPHPATLATLPTRTEVASAFADYLEEVRAQKIRRLQAMSGDTPDMITKPDVDIGKQIRQTARQTARGHYAVQVGARVCTALVSPTPFAERLVHFWPSRRRK